MARRMALGNAIWITCSNLSAPQRIGWHLWWGPPRGRTIPVTLSSTISWQCRRPPSIQARPGWQSRWRPGQAGTGPASGSRSSMPSARCWAKTLPGRSTVRWPYRQPRPASHHRHRHRLRRDHRRLVDQPI